MLQVEVLETSELGDRSYVAHDGTSAVVIDPQRDIDRVEEVMASKGLRLLAVLESHMHNDYVSGGLELARRADAAYLVNADDPVRFVREPVRDGERRKFGSLSVTAIATPGHTDTHLAFYIEADGDSAGEGPDSGPAAVFTGGSLLFGSVGRTDLVDASRTEELTRGQFRSARRLAELPEDTRVFPTHGFGSFCSSGSVSGAESSTIALERERNDALTTKDEDSFVERLIANLTAYPAYYAHMAPRNLAGPEPIDLRPVQHADATELRERLENKEWVVDLRSRTAYAVEHLTGTIGIELGTQFATYLGWLIPWGAPLTLLGENEQQISDAQRQLARIGIDRPDAAAVGSPASFAHLPDGLGRYEVVSFKDLDALDEADRQWITILDTRTDEERRDGSVPGSQHIPLHAILTRLDEIPDGPVWVHCASGYRASIACSLLARAGHEVTLIDDSFGHAEELGLA